MAMLNNQRIKADDDVLFFFSMSCLQFPNFRMAVVFAIPKFKCYWVHVISLSKIPLPKGYTYLYISGGCIHISWCLEIFRSAGLMQPICSYIYIYSICKYNDNCCGTIPQHSSHSQISGRHLQHQLHTCAPANVQWSASMSQNPKTLSFHTEIAGTANGCPPNLSNFILQIWNTIWNDDLTAMERYQTIGFDPSPYLSIPGCRLRMSSCYLPAVFLRKLQEIFCLSWERWSEVS